MGREAPASVIRGSEDVLVTSGLAAPDNSEAGGENPVGKGAEVRGGVAGANRAPGLVPRSREARVATRFRIPSRLVLGSLEHEGLIPVRAAQASSRVAPGRDRLSRRRRGDQHVVEVQAELARDPDGRVGGIRGKPIATQSARGNVVSNA